MTRLVVVGQLLGSIFVFVGWGKRASASKGPPFLQCTGDREQKDKERWAFGIARAPLAPPYKIGPVIYLGFRVSLRLNIHSSQ